MHFAEAVEGAGPDQPCTATTARLQADSQLYVQRIARYFRGRFVQYEE
jgi:hypothetical protein